MARVTPEELARIREAAEGWEELRAKAGSWDASLSTAPFCRWESEVTPSTVLRLVEEIEALRRDLHKCSTDDEALHEGCTLAPGHPTLRLLEEARAEIERLRVENPTSCPTCGGEHLNRCDL